MTCSDGVVVRLGQDYFERSVFNNPDIAAARSYTLQCGARSDVVNALLDVIDCESETVTITEDNFEELRELCKELGFRGLDKELHAFRGNDSVDLQEFLQLKERVARQDKHLSEIQRQLSELLTWKRKAESQMRETVSHQFQSLEGRIEGMVRACEERNMESSRKMDKALKECAKRNDIEALARDVAQLKENMKKGALTWRQEFIYDESKKLDGVIAHLTRECGGNVHDRGIVNVTGTSVCEGKPENVADLGTDSLYWSRNRENAWICYDFKERRVIPTSYSVMSCTDNRGGWHPKSWVIEVSNDGTENSWTKLDCRDNNDDLNYKLVTVNFKISRVPRESFRFFRFRQTGKNHHRSDSLALCSLEIFGTLVEK